jgi:formate dehydrogenase subunit delta
MSEIEHDPAQKLARMAGQIAAFYRAYPEAEAVAGIANHINTFWSRRMREDFLTFFPQGDERLDPLVRAARGRIRGAHPPQSGAAG